MCLDAKYLFLGGGVKFEKSRWTVAATKDNSCRPYPALNAFQWQSKVIDLVDPSLSSFLYSFLKIYF
jgi:hypothetical protein